MKPMITVQYLEDAPEIAGLEIRQVIEKLRAARERLPFSHLLIGWNLPPLLLEACRKEADRLGLRFMRWHPLLTGDSVTQPLPTRQTEGATGRKIQGYHSLPEFTFMCPNHPEVREVIRRRMEDLLRDGLYQGFFLDRIRFPSPAGNPLTDLGCFCEHCRLEAKHRALDLEAVRRQIHDLAGTERGLLNLAGQLLNITSARHAAKESDPLGLFLEFRVHCIAEFVSFISGPLKEEGLEIGLDCFSPSLAWMVGQDLNALGTSADWIKVMSYAHTLGPAGLPFELLGIFDFLRARTGLSEAEVLSRLVGMLTLPLPSTRRALEMDGLSPMALEQELQRGIAASGVPILAGIEFVELEGLTHLNEMQMQADLAAAVRAKASGLAISWDLLHIPLERLELINRFYAGKRQANRITEQP